MAVDLFGWDLTYRSVFNELRKKEDLLVAFTHWYIIKNGFFCIGNGDSKVIKGDEIRSETLPPHWNANDDYNIRYIYNDKVYLLRASTTGGDIILNFLRGDDLCISSCVFKVNDTVKELKGDITTTMPDYKNILSILRKELVEPVFLKTTHAAAGTQTMEKVKCPAPVNRQDPYSPEAPDIINDPLGVPLRRPTIPPMPGLNPQWNNPVRDPHGIGRSDLDPFGQGLGGGMIFDPLNPRLNRNADPLLPGPSNPHGLPTGSVPPGARFDPFAPPGLGRGGSGSRRIEPDPDHLPPPGYDDMFINNAPPGTDPCDPQRRRGRGRGTNNQPPGHNNSFM